MEDVVNVVDLRTCKRGDRLITRSGEEWKYIQLMNLSDTNYPHEVLCDDQNKTYMTNDGRVWKHGFAHDDDIVKIISI